MVYHEGGGGGSVMGTTRRQAGVYHLLTAPTPWPRSSGKGNGLWGEKAVLALQLPHVFAPARST